MGPPGRLRSFHNVGLLEWGGRLMAALSVGIWFSVAFPLLMLGGFKAFGGESDLFVSVLDWEVFAYAFGMGAFLGFYMGHAVAEIQFEDGEEFLRFLITTLARSGLRVQKEVGQQIVLAPAGVGALSQGPLHVIFFPLGVAQVVVTTVSCSASVVGPRHYVKQIIKALEQRNL